MDNMSKNGQCVQLKLSPVDMSSESPRAASLTPKKAKTRALICDTARELFFAHGFEATTMEQIASSAGTRRSTLYTHFRDKNQILTEIIYCFMQSNRHPTRGGKVLWFECGTLNNLVFMAIFPSIRMKNLPIDSLEEQRQPLTKPGHNHRLLKSKN